MQITLTFAIQNHLKWLKQRDHHVNETILKKKISNKEIIVAKSEDEILGWLRFGFFWDLIPFINMLYIEEEYRKKGIGKKLVLFWEAEMKKKNHRLVMTSSQSNEEAQHFYRKLGYTDSGSFTLPKEPLEVIFIKNL